MSGRAATETVIPGRHALSVGNPQTETPEGWSWLPLGELATMGTGHTPSRSVSAYWDGDVQWMGIRDARACHGGQIWNTAQTITQAGLDNSSARLLPGGTVALSRTASVGYVVQLGREMATSQDFVTWTCSAALDPLFLMRTIQAEGDDIRNFGEGSTHTTIYFPELKALHVRTPPVPEQRRIVAKIDRLSARSKRARAELERVYRLVANYKRSILKAGFEGRLSSGKLVGWRKAQLHEIADIQSGVALGKKRNAETKLVTRPYLRVANVQRGWLNLAEIKHTEVSPQEADRLRLQPGDILMNEGGDRDKLGRGWVWEGQVEDCIHQNHVFRVRLKDRRYPSELISLFTNEFGQEHFLNEGKQTTNLASISKAKLSTLPLILPPTDEAIEIVRRIEHAFAAIDRLAAEAASAQKLLDRLDQAVLAKAFRGELVPQDPDDEPASVLLARICAERAAAPAPKRGRRPKAEGRAEPSPTS